jgi:hypothetical protein
MALLSAQTVTKAGTTPSYSAVNASDTITAVTGVLQFLHVKNANGSNCTVTITDAGVTPAGSAATNPTVVVPLTSGDKMIGPLSNALASTSTGLITVSYSVTSSVTAALISVPISN